MKLKVSCCDFFKLFQISLRITHEWKKKSWRTFKRRMKGAKKKNSTKCIAWRNLWYLKIVTFFLHSCCVEEASIRGIWVKQLKVCWTYVKCWIFYVFYYSIDEDGFEIWFCNILLWKFLLFFVVVLNSREVELRLDLIIWWIFEIF